MRGKLVGVAILIALITAGYAGAAEELIGEWLLTTESGSDMVAIDTSAYGNDATLVGNPDWAGAQGFVFDGDSFFELTDLGYPFDFDESFRLEFDIKAAVPGAQLGIFSNNPGSFTYSAWSAVLASGGNLLTTCHSIGTITGTKLVADNIWHTIKMTFDAGNLTWSVDDVADTINGPLNLAQIIDDNSTVWIGRHSSTARLIGSLRNVRVYRLWDIAFNPWPAHNATGVPTGAQTLTWLTPDEAIEQFDVYLSTDENLVETRDAGIKTSLNIGDPNELPTTLAGDTTYYWAVDGLISGAVTAAGDVWQFTTQGNYPVGLTPADETENVSIFTTLDWNVDSAADSYNLYLANSLAELDTVAPIVVNDPGLNISYADGPLDLHRTYYWKVAAIRSGTPYETAPQMFRTNGQEVLDAFDYATQALLEAAWVGAPSEISIQAINFNASAMEIPYHTSFDVSYTKTFDADIDGTTAPVFSLMYWFGFNEEVVNFTVDILDEFDNVIMTKTFDPGVEIDEDTDLGTWNWFEFDLHNEVDADKIRKVTISIPPQSVEDNLYVDNVRLVVPSCDGDLALDFYGDCQIDMLDVLELASAWLNCQRYPASLCNGL